MAPAKKAVGATDQTKSDLGLLRSGNLADATIVCGGRTWKIHKVIVASRCDWFRAALYGSFAEAHSGKITFPEHDPAHIDLLLQHIYGEDIVPAILKQEGAPRLCADLMVVADFFRLEPLREAILRIAVSYLDAKSIFPLPYSAVPDNAFDWLDELFAGIESAYQHDIPAMEPLREYFVTFVWGARCELMECQDFLDRLAGSPEFHLSFSKALLERENWPKTRFSPYEIRGLRYGSKYKRTPLKMPGFEKTPIKCGRCKSVVVHWDVAYYNTRPVTGKLGPQSATAWRARYSVASRAWCKGCKTKMVKDMVFPWRTGTK